MERIVRCVAIAASTSRDQYVAIHDDLPEGWTLNSTLVFLGLRIFATGAKPKPTLPTDEEAKALYVSLPGPEAALLLSTYSFVNSNKLFATKLATLSAPSKSTESPFSAFLSLTSYLGHHAFRSERCLHYSLLSLFTLRIMTEDNLAMKQLTSPDAKTSVRLCRQRAPFLPLITSDRIPILAVLDICIMAITHNLRKRLDVPLHKTSLFVIHRVLTYLSRQKLRLPHQWSYMWGSLLSLLRFLTQYSSSLQAMSPDISNAICIPLTTILSFALTNGDTFLPSASDYDDLLYKIVQAGQGSVPTTDQTQDTSTTATTSLGLFSKFTTSYSLTTDPSSKTLLQIFSHFQSLLTTTGTNTAARKQHYSPHEVAAVLKEGYETLDTDVGSATDFGAWTPWREGEEKALLKRIIRSVVEDARRWVSRG